MIYLWTGHPKKSHFTFLKLHTGCTITEATVEVLTKGPLMPKRVSFLKLELIAHLKFSAASSAEVTSAVFFPMHSSGRKITLWKI